MLVRGPQDIISPGMKGGQACCNLTLWATPEKRRPRLGQTRVSFSVDPSMELCSFRERAEIDAQQSGAACPETGRKPIHQGKGQGSTEEVSRAGQGSDVGLYEWFSQNSLCSWLGCSAGLRWGLNKAGMSQKARAQSKALRAEGSTVLTAGYSLPPPPERSWVVPKDQDFETSLSDPFLPITILTI